MRDGTSYPQVKGTSRTSADVRSFGQFHRQAADHYCFWAGVSVDLLKQTGKVTHPLQFGKTHEMNDVKSPGCRTNPALTWRLAYG
jgi:hypothetical protein